MVYVIEVCWQLASRIKTERPDPARKLICQVYGDNAMSDGMVRKWVRMFNEGPENVHDEARSGRPSLVNDDLVRKVFERVGDDRRFTISDLSLHFPQISRTLLYSTILYSMTLSVVANIAGGRILCGGYTKTCPHYDKCINNGGEYVEK